MAVHIAMDNTVVMEEISKWLRVWLTRPKKEPQLESLSLSSTGTSQQVEA